MPPLVALERLLVAVLVGFLIGLDRERTEARKERRLFAGVRTFPLIALAGAVPMLLFDRVGPALLVVSFVAVAAIAVASYVHGMRAGDVGATTEVAGIATFLLGVLAGAGAVVEAGAAGVVVAILLVAKPRLEAFSRALTESELFAALELAVISVIVLPLLPNEGYGPWQVFNPFHVWLVVVLVSGLGFAGFVAMRLLGQRRGMTVAAIVGALVSSTAVTVAMAAESRQATALGRVAAGAAVLASTIMSLRVLVLVGAVDLGIVPRVTPVILVMSLVGALSARRLLRDPEVEERAVEANIQNPFNLRAALTFGGVFAAIVLLVRAAEEYFGVAGIYVAAALSAVADVDAVSIALARLGPGRTAWREPAVALTVAVVTNTVVKLGIGVVMGAGSFRTYIAVALGLTAAAGAATGLLVDYAWPW